jgi:hypothetical protein
MLGVNFEYQNNRDEVRMIAMVSKGTMARWDLGGITSLLLVSPFPDPSLAIQFMTLLVCEQGRGGDKKG